MMAHKNRAVYLSMFLVAVLLTTAFFAAAQAQTKGPIAKYTAITDNVSGAGDTVRIDLLAWSTDTERDQFVAAWNLTAPAGGAGRGGGRGAGAAPGGAPGGGGGAAGAPRGGGAGRGGARGAGAPPAAEPAQGGAQTPTPAAANPAAPAPAAAGGDAAAPAAAGRGGRGGGARGGGGGRGGGGDAAGAAAPAAPPETPASSLAGALQRATTVGILWTSESTGYSIRYAYKVAQPDGSQRIILATDRRLGSWNTLWKPTGTATPTDYEFSVIELHLNAKGEGEGRASLTGKVAVDSATKSMALENYSALPIVLKTVKRQSGS